MKENQAKATRTNAWGGDGGSSFDDGKTVTEKFGRIRQIEVCSTSYFTLTRVEFIGFLWENGKFIGHGSTASGTSHLLTLDHDESINKVTGKTSHVLNQITFHTNKGRILGPFGKGGANDFYCNFGNQAVHYLFGRCCAAIDRIGFGLRVPAEPKEHCFLRSETVGQNGGTEFDDFQQYFGSKLGNIKQIQIGYGDRVERLEISYDNGPKITHGQGGKYSEEICLTDCEYLVQVSGRVGRYYVDQLQFFTSKDRNFGPFGKRQGKEFNFARQNHVIKAFFGRSGARLDRLGVYFETDSKPLSAEILEMEFDTENGTIEDDAKDTKVISVELTNNTDIEQVVDKTHSIEIQTSRMTSITNSSTMSLDLKFTQKFDVMMVGKFGVELGVGYSSSSSETTGETETKTYSDSMKFSAKVPPRQKLKAEAKFVKKRASVPWTAKALVKYSTFERKETLHGVLEQVDYSKTDARYDSVPVGDVSEHQSTNVHSKPLKLND